DVRCRRHGCANSRLENARRIRTAPARFGVRELIAQGSDIALGERPGDRLHEPVPHACAGTMREHVEAARLGGLQQEARDPAHPLAHFDRTLPAIETAHPYLPMRARQAVRARGPGWGRDRLPRAADPPSACSFAPARYEW